GRIVEQGTHDELMGLQGAYSRLIEAQSIASQRGKEDGDLETDMPSYMNEKVANLDDKAAANIGSNHDRDLIRKTTTLAGHSPDSESQAEALHESTKSPYPLWMLIRLIFSFNREEWYLLAVGLFFSIICGGGNPT